MGEKWNMHRLLVGKTEGKTTLGRQDMGDKWRALVNALMKLQVL
jgi:hypothetical protein